MPTVEPCGGGDNALTRDLHQFHLHPRGFVEAGSGVAPAPGC